MSEPRKAWEYRTDIVELLVEGLGKIRPHMNSHGKSGWELVSCVRLRENHEGVCLLYIYKRPIAHDEKKAVGRPAKYK